MNRRLFMAAGASVIIGATGIVYVSNRKTTVALPSIAQTIAKLESCKAKTVTSTGQWQPAVIFQHCAQSINMSILGYPEHKSDVFKSTVGTVAFALFEANGGMTHDLSEPIPGAPSLDNTASVNYSVDMLIRALRRFEQYDGEMAPHFAYGKLSKAQYTGAHIMHIENHFEQLLLA